MTDQPKPSKEANVSAPVPPIRQRKLSPSRRARLLRAADQYKADKEAARQRYRSVLEKLIAEGAAVAAIARELGISRQAVHDRLHRGQHGPDRPKPSKDPQ